MRLPMRLRCGFLTRHLVHLQYSHIRVDHCLPKQLGQKCVTKSPDTPHNCAGFFTCSFLIRKDHGLFKNGDRSVLLCNCLNSFASLRLLLVFINGVICIFDGIDVVHYQNNKKQ